jgi:hypothetical protein
MIEVASIEYFNKFSIPSKDKIDIQKKTREPEGSLALNSK